MVVHCTVEEALEGADLDPATEVVLLIVVLDVPALVAVTDVVLLVAEVEVAVLDAVAVVLLVVVVDAPVLDAVVEVLLPAVLDAPVLAVVAEVFCVVVGGAAGVCGDSVCAKRIAAERKPQTRMTIERFMDHPFEDIVEGKVPRP